MPTTSKPIGYLGGPTPFAGARGGLVLIRSRGPLSFSHQGIRASGHMIISIHYLWGPVLLRTQAHGPLMLHLWGPLKYYQTFHHAHGRPHRHLYITLGAGPSIYTPPEGVSLRDSRVFLIAEYKERGGLGGIAPWFIPPIPPGPFTRCLLYTSPSPRDS